MSSAELNLFRQPDMLPFSLMRALLSGILLLACNWTLPAAKNLEIYSIDVEGGQATLLVSPSGQSLLIDTGWPGLNHRDAGRIAAAAKAAGVHKIDYLLITHYHTDHAGGVQGLAKLTPILNFADHGPQTETGKDAEILFNEYASFRDKGNHILAKPGDLIPIKVNRRGGALVGGQRDRVAAAGGRPAHSGMRRLRPP